MREMEEKRGTKERESLEQRNRVVSFKRISVQKVPFLTAGLDLKARKRIPIAGVGMEFWG